MLKLAKIYLRNEVFFINRYKWTWNTKSIFGSDLKNVSNFFNILKIKNFKCSKY